MQHQARFRQGCMEPLAALGLRDQSAESFRAAPEEARQHGQAGNGAAQLAGSGLEQGDLAAMAVEQNESLEAGASQLLTNRHNLGDELVRRQGEGAGKTVVLG
jgi:hypothetical protein